MRPAPILPPFLTLIHDAPRAQALLQPLALHDAPRKAPAKQHQGMQHCVRCGVACLAAAAMLRCICAASFRSHCGRCGAGSGHGERCGAANEYCKCCRAPSHGELTASGVHCALQDRGAMHVRRQPEVGNLIVAAALTAPGHTPGLQEGLGAFRSSTGLSSQTPASCNGPGRALLGNFRGPCSHVHFSFAICSKPATHFSFAICSFLLSFPSTSTSTCVVRRGWRSRFARPPAQATL